MGRVLRLGCCGCYVLCPKWLAAQHLRSFLFPIVLFDLLEVVAHGFHYWLPVPFSFF
jgi:hypothetical protein